MKQNNISFKETGDRTVFNTPENYFVNFKAELGKRLDALKSEGKQVDFSVKPATKSKGFVLRMETIKPYLYIAAMFVLLLFSISLVLNIKSKSSSSLGLSVESNSINSVSTTEDYLINSVGTTGITEYYMGSEDLE